MSKFIPITPSSLGTMLTCPKQFEAKYITKEVKFQQTEATIWGNRVHTALETALKHNVTPVEEFANLAPYVETFRNMGGTLQAETKLAIDRNEQPIGWWDRYMGGIADVLVVKGRRALVGDLKTGKFRPEDTQLHILTRCVLAAYPEVDVVNGVLFHPHLNKNHIVKVERGEPFHELNRDIEHYETIQELGDFKPRPSGLCKKWCDVMSCPHNGRR